MTRTKLECPRCLQIFSQKGNLENHLSKKNLCRDVGSLLKQKDELLEVYKKAKMYDEIIEDENVIDKDNILPFGKWELPSKMKLDGVLTARHERENRILDFIIYGIVYDNDFPQNRNIRVNLEGRFEVYSEKSKRFVRKSGQYVVRTLTEEILVPIINNISDYISENRMSLYDNEEALLMKRLLNTIYILKNSSNEEERVRKYIRNVEHMVEYCMTRNV